MGCRRARNERSWIVITGENCCNAPSPTKFVQGNLRQQIDILAKMEIADLGITLEPHYSTHFRVHNDISVITEQPYTLEPHYNTHFGVHSDISLITEQPYNEGLIHRKYKQWEPCL